MDQLIMTPCEECRALMTPAMHEYLIAHLMLAHALSQELAVEMVEKMSAAALTPA
jgi:hypothetical protein